MREVAPVAGPADSPDAGGKIIPLGERLRLHRVERGMSQAQAARELDVARTAYRLWELEASKPSPDRWRLIAGWLGVSISTMLLGEDLIDQEDAEAAGQIADRVARAGEGWDEIGAASPGDFFEQERSTIARQTRSGTITPVESGRLTASLDRVLASVQARAELPPPSEFRKALIADVRAPELARTALLVTAAGLPDSIVERAELLTSELVSNSVERGESHSVWLSITSLPDVLRVEVADGTGVASGPEQRGPKSERARWSMAIVSELASRWGAGRDTGLNVAWFEIDIVDDASARP